MAPFKKILVPTDFSESSALAVERALELGHLLGATVTLLHVYEPPIVYTEVYAFSAELIGEIDRGAREAMAGALDRATARAAQLAGDRQPTPIESKVMAGRPSLTIVEEAREGGHDLIVMGTHGRRGLSRMFIGSVAERVVRTAPCAVLAVRASARGT